MVPGHLPDPALPAPHARRAGPLAGRAVAGDQARPGEDRRLHDGLLVPVVGDRAPGREVDRREPRRSPRTHPGAEAGRGPQRVQDVGVFAIGSALLLLVLSPILKRWMHGVQVTAQYRGTAGSTTSDQRSMPPAIEATLGKPGLREDRRARQAADAVVAVDHHEVVGGRRARRRAAGSSPSGMSTLPGRAQKAFSSGWRTSRR